MLIKALESLTIQIKARKHNWLVTDDTSSALKQKWLANGYGEQQRCLYIPG